jgi:hypothetical protein
MSSPATTSHKPFGELLARMFERFRERAAKIAVCVDDVVSGDGR